MAAENFPNFCLECWALSLLALWNAEGATISPRGLLDNGMTQNASKPED